MEVYLSSSWKNQKRVRELAINLRRFGIIAYDFTDPRCRDTPEIPPEKFPKQFDPALCRYSDYIQAVPEWRQAVLCNQRALVRCDVCLLLLPCGLDAHSAWAFAVGKGKRTAVVGHPNAGDWIPTHLWANAILDDDVDAVSWCVDILDDITQENESPKGAYAGVIKRPKRRCNCIDAFVSHAKDCPWKTPDQADNADDGTNPMHSFGHGRGDD